MNRRGLLPDLPSSTTTSSRLGYETVNRELVMRYGAVGAAQAYSWDELTLTKLGTRNRRGDQ